MKLYEHSCAFIRIATLPWRFVKARNFVTLFLSRLYKETITLSLDISTKTGKLLLLHFNSLEFVITVTSLYCYSYSSALSFCLNNNG